MIHAVTCPHCGAVVGSDALALAAVREHTYECTERPKTPNPGPIRGSGLSRRRRAAR